jgi:hypothetical protein
MNTLLNIATFSLCIWWFWNHAVIHRKKVLIGIVGAFLLVSFLVLILSLYAQAEYLDGVHYLIAGGVSVLLFWSSATVLVIWKNMKDRTTDRMVMDLVQVMPLLLIPVILWVWISTMSFKIGG